MGNTHIREFFQNQENLHKKSDYLNTFPNADILNHGQYLSDKWITLNIEKVKDANQLFDWNNVQVNSTQLETVDEQIRLRQFKENLIIGQLPQSSSSNLLNPQLFDECQVSFSPANVINFKDHQNQKFLVLNHLFFLSQNIRNKDSSALSSIKNHLSQSQIPKAAEVGIRSGIHLIVSLLREVSQNNIQLRDQTLDFLIELFAEVKPLSLWGNNKIDIIMDKSLHTVADFLEEIIQSDKTNQDGKSKALKVLFSLGLLRGSLPNLLAVVNLLRTQPITIDLANEIKLLKNEKADSTLKFEKFVKVSSKIYFSSSISSDTKADKSTYVSITNDGKFLYIFSEVEGLLKIGTGYDYTMLGKVYKHLPEYRNKEKGSLAYVQGKLFYRSSKIQPAPIIEIDPETLEEVSDINLNFDQNEPNCLWPEMTNPQIEFPHLQVSQQTDENDQLNENSTSNQIENNQQKQNKQVKVTQKSSNIQQKRDVLLMRPSQRSPMFTEGRYIYIISQWTVEQSRRQNEDDEDEEETGQQNEIKYAKFGVDIYDPLNNFEHIRSVELYDPEQFHPKNLKDQSKNKIKSPLSSALLDSGSFATNGTELVVGVPSNLEDTGDIKYKYFDLKDGKLTNVSINKDSNAYPRLSFDYTNNVVWGVSDNKKSFEFICCYNNANIPDKLSFGEDTDFFQPYENERIVDIALEGMGFYGVGLDKNKENLDKLQEDWHTLLNLGFTNQDMNIFTLQKQQVFLKKGEDSDSQAQATQLVILASISRLAESYANLEYKNEQSQNNGLENFRKPYCVSLMPKVFNYLEMFLDQYSKSLFDKNEQKKNQYELCSFLCTLRILKYNLAHIEQFSQQLKKLKVQLPSLQFQQKYKKIILDIFSMQNEQQQIDGEFEEIYKALYQEALSIYQHNLPIIFPSVSEILYELQDNISKINNQINRDIVLSLLSWLSKKSHIKSLVEELVDPNNLEKQEMIALVNKVIEFITCYEVQNYNNWLQSVNDLNDIGQYNQKDQLIQRGMAFVIEYQKEILYNLGVRVQEKNMDLDPIILLGSSLTEIVTSQAIKVNEHMTERIPQIGQNIYKQTSLRYEEYLEQQKQLKSNNKNKKKEKSLEQLVIEDNSKMWDILTLTLQNKVYFQQVSVMQINALCLLSSNFLIAAKSMKQVSTLLNSQNKLYNQRKQMNSKEFEKIQTFMKEKSEVFESEHPTGQVKADTKEKIHIQGAKQLRLVFDPKCDLKKNCDYIQFFSDEQCKNKITEKCDRSGDDSKFPKNDLIIEGDTVWFKYFSDNCKNSTWGYKFTVYANIQDSQDQDWMSGFHRTTCWLASKCSAQLINGSALQQVMMQDEEQKFNNLLNSKLFSGGMEKYYFSGGKEEVWIQLSDIINEFEAGHLSEYLSSKMTEEEKLVDDILNHIINGDSCPKTKKLLDYINQQFAKECLWANLGGEKAGKLVRAAFTVVVKHAGLAREFFELTLNVDQIISQKKPTDKILINLIKKWQSASRMRQWLVEKRKDIDDLAEKQKYQNQAAQQTETKAVKKMEQQIEAVSKSMFRGGGRGGRGKKKKKNSNKNKEKDEEIIIQNQQEEENNVPQPSMKIQDTEEIIDRIIDNIIKKALFLIQLIPAKHWSQDSTEHKDQKLLLFKSPSQMDEFTNKDEEWKTRLQQWKIVRQSNTVFKSLEEEVNEIHLSLTTSVLGCLQSPVSVRRLRKQVESAYIRAICRTIGLNALTQILLSVQGSLFRQDVIGWLCSSLRGSENKLYHFTDTLQGCGHYLEGTVNTAFKNLIIAIVKSMSTSNSTDEIKCMLEGLKWKYHGDDHAFLAEINLFSILRGKDEKSLLRKAWGKKMNDEIKKILTTIKNNSETNIDMELVKKTLELFEIIVILCVGKLKSKGQDQEKSLQYQPHAKKQNLGMLKLERHESVVDEFSAEILIRQAFDVIFHELRTADENYRNFQGLDWGAYTRAKLRLQKKEEEKKKKNNKKGNDNRYNEYGEEYRYGEEQEEIEQKQESDSDSDKSSKIDETEAEIYDNIEDDKQDAEEEKDDSEEQEEKQDYEPEIGEVWDIRTMRRLGGANKQEQEKNEPQQKSKEEQEKDQKQDALKKRQQKIKQMIEKEEKLLSEAMFKLYNPEFLFRLLSLVYKCVNLGLDQVSIVCTPKNIAILLSLMRTGSPPAKLLLIKILSQILKILPVELFEDSVFEYVNIKNSKNKYSINKELQDGPNKLLSLLFSVVFNIRKRTFQENIEYPEDFTFSQEIVNLIRELLANQEWQDTIKQYLDYIFNQQGSIDLLYNVIALQILGGESLGLRFGTKIRFCSTNPDDLFDDNVLLKDHQQILSQADQLNQENETAVVIGFSSDYKEKLQEEEKKQFKAPTDDPRFHIQISQSGLDANQSNPVILSMTAIPKEITSFSAVELQIYNKFNQFAIDSVPFNPKNYDLSKNLLELYRQALSPENALISESKQILWKTVTIKSLATYLKDQDSVVKFIKNEDMTRQLLQLANRRVISQSQQMNLELTEEKLFRLLKRSAETSINLNDLSNISITIKRNELEVLLGKSFSNLKYPISSGYNTEKINQFYDLVLFDELDFNLPVEKLMRKIEGRALIIKSESVSNPQNNELINVAKILITHDYDLQSLQEQLEGTNKQKKTDANAKQNSQQMDDKTQNKVLQKQKSKQIRSTPFCIVNLTEKYFLDLIQINKDQEAINRKNVFEQKSIIDELVELGFPKDLVQSYLNENPRSSLEQVITDIVKIIEQREIDKEKELKLEELQKENKAEKKSEKKISEKINEKNKKKKKSSNSLKKRKQIRSEDDEEFNSQDESDNFQDSQDLEEDQVEDEVEDDESSDELQNKEEGQEDIFLDDEINPDDDAEAQDNDVENEDPNSCFKCRGEKEIQQLTDEKNDLFEQSVEFEGLNKVGKIILFKQVNYNLTIFYARRAILNILEILSSQSDQGVLPNPILQDTESAILFLKLISFEAVFSSSTFSNNFLIGRISKLLTNYLEKGYFQNKFIYEFLDQIVYKCIIEPLYQLNKQFLDVSETKTQTHYTGRLNNESELDLPFLEFSLKLMDIIIYSKNLEFGRKLLNLDLLYIIMGLFTLIRQNKFLGWSMMIFGMKFIKFIQQNLNDKIIFAELSKNNLFQNNNVKKLHEYMHILKSKEKSEQYSKRIQICTELMVETYRLQKVLRKSQAESTETGQKSIDNLGETGFDLEKFKLIQNITDTVDIMENYDSNQKLTATTWLQKSEDLVHFEQKSIDGDHFYFKNLHTFKVHLPNTSETTIKFQEDSQTDIGDSVLFTSDQNGQLSIQKYSGNLNQKSVVFPSGTFYVHFPSKGSDIYCWGLNEQAQLGIGENSQQGPYSLDNLNTANVKYIRAGDQHTLILNKNGDLYSCGTGQQTGSSTQAKIFQQINTKGKVKLIGAGSNFTILYTQENELYGIGSNQDGRCGLNWNSGSQQPQLIEFSKSKVIKQIACGQNHSLILSTDNQLYVSGSNDNGQLGLIDDYGNPQANQTIFRNNSDKSLNKKKIIFIAAGQNCSFIIIQDLDKQTYVMSCGEKNGGRLGLGQDHGAKVPKFEKLRELNNKNIKFISVFKKHALALSSTGKVFGWGNNEFGQLGLSETIKNDSEYKPKQISFFQNMRVISCCAGSNHSLFVTQQKVSENNYQTSLYGCGENANNKLLLKTTKEKITLPTIIDIFQGKNPLSVYCGANHNFLMTENMDIPKYRDRHPYTCAITKQNPIKGPMLIDLYQKDIFYQFDAVTAQQEQPAITLFVKENIFCNRDFSFPQLPETVDYYLENQFDNNQKAFEHSFCHNCNQSPITNVLYVSCHLNQISLDLQKQVSMVYNNKVYDELCEKCVPTILEFQVSPTIYYRLTRPLKQGVSLPQYSRNQFFTNSETYGLHLILEPKFSEDGLEYMIEKYRSSYEQFSEDFKNMLPETDEQLVDLLNNLAQKREKSVFDLDDNISFPKDELSIRNALEKQSQEFLRKRFMILKNFNKKVKTVIPFIDFSAKKNQNRMRNIYSSSSSYIFWDVKSDIFEKILTNNAKAASNFKVKINRLKASKFVQKHIPDHTAEFTVFGQLFQSFKNQDLGIFKVGKDQNPFSVQFIGEASIDVGGPYRETISQICTEMQSVSLPLLIPSPNQKNDSGQNREKWVLNPGANTLIHMKMFEFVGLLMGASIRSKNFMNLDLPSIVWKQLVDAPLIRKDLEYIDRYTIQCLDDVKNIDKKGIDETTFNEIIQEKFVTCLSDGTEVELIQGGKNKLVTFESRFEYCQLVEEIRLLEFKKQAEALRQGILQVVPEGLLNLLTWRELETLVCGKPILDVDLLRANTVYRGCSENDPVIEFFWRALREFTLEERSMYLRFVWGRSRLPLTSKDFPMKHQIEIIKKSGIDHDLMLPIAHTCFFQLELPKYSSFEILNNKLLYAIKNCQAIDTDGRAYDIWEDED